MSTKNQNPVPASPSAEVSAGEISNKGPFRFFTGALTSCLLAWLCFGLSRKLVIYFTLHSSDYSSAIAQSVASGFKTLVIGMCFLATFTFGFIGFGLILVFIRSLFDGNSSDTN